MTSFKDVSRQTWNASNSVEHINAGSFQRIADACELMAKNHAALIADRDWWKARAEARAAEVSRLTFSIRSLRGAITRLRNAAEKTPTSSAGRD